MIAIYALGAVAAAEAVAILVQSKRLARRTDELAEAQRKVDTRANLLSGGREAVKQMWLYGLAQGGPEQDFTELIKHIEKWSDVTVGGKAPIM